MKKETHSPEEFAREARTFALLLKPLPDRATVIALSGELGAGKTAYTKAMAQGLGIHELVTSPTFVLEKMYKIRDSAFNRLVHIDAYRLTGGEDLKPLRFDELLKDPRALVVIEWPERIAAAIGKPAWSIKIEQQADHHRQFTYEQNP
jgi:tRNA threonylcarbamoyladenosine biosynthesis protein TsaE